MLGVVTSVFAGLSWGVASFSSGRASRKMSAPLLTAIYNFLGLIFFGVLFFTSGETNSISETNDWVYSTFLGAIGGLGFSIGLVCIARGMSRGRSGIIGPILTIISILIPVVFTAIVEELPGTFALIGIAVLLVVPYLATRTHTNTAVHITRSKFGDVGFGIASGMGFGLYYIALIASPESSQLFVLTIVQLTSMIVMLSAHIVSRASWQIDKNIRGVVYLFLLFELLGVIFLRLSLNATSGAIVSAVSSSMDQVGILALSRIFNKEFFTKPQIAGFGVLVVGIFLVSLNA